MTQAAHQEETTDIAANMRGKKRKPRPRQQESLPGIGIPEVESAARDLRDVRAERMAMQETEAEMSDKLLDVMDDHGLTSFRFEEDGVRFVARIKQNRKVSVVKDDEDEREERKAKSPQIESGILGVAEAAQRGSDE